MVYELNLIHERLLQYHYRCQLLEIDGILKKVW